MDVNSSILELKGVGEKTGKLFAKLDIRTLNDLLCHVPRDYEIYEDPVSIAQAQDKALCAVCGTLTGKLGERRAGSLHILTAALSDGTGVMQLHFFNMPYLKKVLKPGENYLFRGTVKSRGNAKIMEQPRMFRPEEYHRQTNRLLPRYSLTKGLTNQAVQKAVKQALEQCQAPEECYDGETLDSCGLMSRQEALYAVHFPPDRETLIRARKRLVFDEFFPFLYLLRRNRQLGEGLKNDYPMLETADTVRFLEQLPFPLTKAQQKVWQEIREDMSGPNCMNRLIQGDVGSGKTILAVLALLMTAANGFQGALMAPTEVLAMQHFETVRGYVKQYGVCFRPVLLTGSMTAREKREAYRQIETGEANLIIGTHALIQDKAVYHSLALVVTDEQHRFGVRQRETLAGKGCNPHILVMSATPIPRTLAIILYGDLHVSLVNELPQGRIPIKNCVVNDSYRPAAYQFIAAQVAQGRQAYVICPQVEEGENQDLENVTDYVGKLRAVLPPQVQVASLHGRMRPADKNRIMEEFAAHSIDVLVSTTVIEVGINVPNATVMMVENAERFGLAQLHQLRGRVGRGKHQSYCIFVNTKETEETSKRLNILNGSNDGFQIASEDLKLRGPGELFGVRQSGELAFRMGDIYTDADVLKLAADTLEHLLQQDPELSESRHLPLRRYLEQSVRDTVDFRSI